MYRRKRIAGRLLCILLGMSMTFSMGGCADTPVTETGTEKTDMVTETEESKQTDPVSSQGNENIHSTEGEGAETEPIFREPIDVGDDFFQYVNPEYGTYEFTPSEYRHGFLTETEMETYRRLQASLDLEDIGAYDPDSGMYKILTIYEQMQDERHREEAGLEGIQRYLERIDQVKNLDQMYKLFMQEDMAVFNSFLFVQYDRTSNGTFGRSMQPGYFYTPLKNSEEKKIITEAFVKELIAVGYTQKQAEKIAANAMEVDARVAIYYMTYTGRDFYYLEPGYNDGVECDYPFFEIWEATGRMNNPRKIGFYAEEAYFSMMNDLFQEKNLEKLKDYYKINVLQFLINAGPEEMRMAWAEALGKMNGCSEFAADEDLKCLLDMQALTRIDPGFLADYYCRNCLNEETLKTTAEMYEEIKLTAKAMIDDLDWAGQPTKGRLKMKVDKLTAYIGCYDTWNDLSDVTISDNIVDNVMGVMMSNERESLHKMDVGVQFFQIKDINMMDTNSYYSPLCNSVYYCSGYLTAVECHPEWTYEQQMGYLGMVVAHELGHCMGPQMTKYNGFGLYTDVMEEKERTNFEKQIKKSWKIFDNLRTESGKRFIAGNKTEETFADYFAHACCLRILSQKEDPDYDAYFKTFAETETMEMTEKYEEGFNRNDTHPLPRLRVNCILGQFDQFYETYQISEDSIYYVAPENRLRLWK